jgi:hypothetical protein
VLGKVAGSFKDMLSWCDKGQWCAPSDIVIKLPVSIETTTQPYADPVLTLTRKAAAELSLAIYNQQVPGLVTGPREVIMADTSYVSLVLSSK